MGYLFRSVLGAALFLGSVVLFNVELQRLLDVGTCASGNTPFVIGQPCPEGTGTSILLLTGSVLAGLIGAAIFAFRGAPPWRSGDRRVVTGLFGWGTLAWGLFFAGTGVAVLVGAPYGELVDPETGETVARPDSQLGATIVAITFLVMGLPALAIALSSMLGDLRRRRASRPARPGGALEAPSEPGSGRSRALLGGGSAGQLGARGPLAGAAGGDRTIDSLERLQRLRESGAIDQREFDREKARILSGR